MGLYRLSISIFITILTAFLVIESMDSVRCDARVMHTGNTINQYSNNKQSGMYTSAKREKNWK